MPEGHTIHRLARDHNRWFGKTTVSVDSPQGRFLDGAELLDGRRFIRATAHGKHLFYEFETERKTGLWVHIHLGLFGRFRNRKKPWPEPTPNTRMRLMNATRCVDLSGPTRCEVLDHSGKAAVIDRLGPDPLRSDCTSDQLIASLARRRSAIGAVLLDQSAVAGIGNVYRSELLFVHRLDPLTPVNEIHMDTLAALWETAVEWLEIGVRTNRIITRYQDQAVRSMPRRERLWVYKKHDCLVCGGPIQVSTLRQRTLYSCPSCQTVRR